MSTQAVAQIDFTLRQACSDQTVHPSSASGRTESRSANGWFGQQLAHSFQMIFTYPTKFSIKRNLVIAGILFILLLTASTTYGEEFQRALPGKVFSFPQDHYSHPEFKTEWWYYTGHLQSEDKKSYGYQITFFRVAFRRGAKGRQSKWAIQDLYFAHLALADESKKRFEYREKMSRGSFGEAGASIYGSKEPFRVWIDDWSMELKGVQLQNHLLKAGGKDFGIELMLIPEKNPIVHGKKGVSQKAEGEGFASHYYSITRLKTEGKIFLKGKEFTVRGVSWMDHEFGSNQLREYQVGWDWFSIQLDNGMDLMLYQVRHRDGKIDPYSSGTIIFSDENARHLALKEFQIEVLEQWKSKKSGATYPAKWSLKASTHQIDLILTPTVKDQELITESSTRVTYWEGSVKVEGKYQGNPVKGLGYVELTGYAKPFNKGI
ncbi:MAG: lipocalin-like domain-containing protein [Thermodesulfobacteriota bacterium]|nr:lipocalin-like domain-containing protein [Thermodesulfobacteriota bacterium]